MAVKKFTIMSRDEFMQKLSVSCRWEKLFRWKKEVNIGLVNIKKKSYHNRFGTSIANTEMIVDGL